eukprot:4238757-Prymnesium_polylepis.2
MKAAYKYKVHVFKHLPRRIHVVGLRYVRKKSCPQPNPRGIPPAGAAPPACIICPNRASATRRASAAKTRGGGCSMRACKFATLPAHAHPVEQHAHTWLKT